MVAAGLSRGAVGVVPTHGCRTRPTGGRSTAVSSPRSAAEAGPGTALSEGCTTSCSTPADGPLAGQAIATESASDWATSLDGGGRPATVQNLVEVVTAPTRATVTQYVVPGFRHSRNRSAVAASPTPSTR